MKFRFKKLTAFIMARRKEKDRDEERAREKEGQNEET